MGDRGRIMTEDERIELVKWAYSLLNDAKPLSNNRAEVKLTNNPSVPELVWKIKRKIVDREGLRLSKSEPYDEDFLGFVRNNGIIHKHTDLNEGGLIHSRFNVFLQLPSEGGQTYYDDKPINAKEGSYVLCRSGLDYHWSDKVKGDKDRISLSFGYLLPLNFLTRLNDKFPI